MRKIMIIAILFMMSGCASGSYVRDMTDGRASEITLEEMQEKLDKKDTFVVAFTTSMCGYCQDFEKMLDSYLPTHNVDPFIIVLDKENRTAIENRKIINNEFPEFDTTPGVFYVENGENKSYLPNERDGVNEVAFDKWVQENRIDKKQ